jgi:cell division protein FtsA
LARDTFYTAVDLGNSKVASVVARVGSEGELKILGTGNVASQGMHKGRIERIDEVQTAVRSSLEEAQRYIGRGVVAGVYAGVSGTHITCINTKDTVDNPGDVRDINAHLLDHLIQSSFPHVDRSQEILHIIPISYDVDGLSGMRNPVGLHADKVQVEAHVVLGDAMTLKNTVKAVESGRVSVRSLVLQSLASAEATLTGDEREMGAVFVDIGSGTTDLVIYRQGSPWYSAVIPVGGDQLTKDLSVALGISVYLAEEAKIKWGHAMPELLRGEDEVVIPSFQGQPRRVVRRQVIAEPLQARVVELLKLILLKVRQSGLRQLPAGGLVITGGCAELQGIRELAKKTLGGPVRIAYPSGIAGLPTQLRKPAFSAAVGLLLWGIKHQGEKRPYRSGLRTVSKHKPLFDWFKRERHERDKVQVG